MRIFRGLFALIAFVGVAYAAWWIAWYAGTQSNGPTLPPPPGWSQTPNP